MRAFHNNHLQIMIWKCFVSISHLSRFASIKFQLKTQEDHCSRTRKSDIRRLLETVVDEHVTIIIIIIIIIIKRVDSAKLGESG